MKEYIVIVYKENRAAIYLKEYNENEDYSKYEILEKTPNKFKAQYVYNKYIYKHFYIG